LKIDGIEVTNFTNLEEVVSSSAVFVIGSPAAATVIQDVHFKDSVFQHGGGIYFQDANGIELSGLKANNVSLENAHFIDINNKGSLLIETLIFDTILKGETCIPTI